MLNAEASIDAIDQLDLNYLIKKLTEKKLHETYQWSTIEAEYAILLYKNFLRLALEYKDTHTRFTPSYEIDQVWHLHILHTKNYIRDCEYIFGKYFHHAPFNVSTERSRAVVQQSFLNTQALHYERFGYYIHPVIEPMIKKAFMQYSLHDLYKQKDNLSTVDESSRKTDLYNFFKYKVHWGKESKESNVSRGNEIHCYYTCTAHSNSYGYFI